MKGIREAIEPQEAIARHLTAYLGKVPQWARYMGVGLDPDGRPNAAEVGRIADRVRQAGASIEEVEEGLLVRDPSRNGVVLASAE